MQPFYKIFLYLIVALLLPFLGYSKLNAKYPEQSKFIDSISVAFQLDQRTEIFKFIDGQARKANEKGDYEYEHELRLLLMKKYQSIDSLSFEAFQQYLFTELNFARESKFSFYEIDVLHAIGENYTGNRRFIHGFEYFLDAYQLYSKYDAEQFPPKLRYLFTLGSTYYRYGDNENALKYVLEAARIREFKLSENLTTYNTIGSCFRNLGMLDSAMHYFKEVNRAATAKGDTVWAIISEGNIGAVLYMQGKTDFAKKQLEENVEKCLKRKIIRNAVGSLQILGQMEIKVGNYDAALKWFNMALKYAREKGFWNDYEMREGFFTDLFKIMKGLHRSDSATMYADSAMAAKDSVNVKNNTLTFAKLQEKVEVVQHQVAKEQLKDQKKINLYLGFVSVLLLVIGVLAFLSQRRTAHLNKQITLQKKEVEQLSDVKNWIFSVISHDLRTPVNSLIAFSQLLESNKLSAEKLSAYVKALQGSLSYTSALMENLLSWARTQMQGYNPVFEYFDLKDHTLSVINLMNTEASRKNITIVSDLLPNLSVYADMNMTALVTRNLLSNAIKYTPNGGTVYVSCYAEFEYAVLSIKDSGAGMEPDKVSNFNSVDVFRPSESTIGTSNEKGSGLGLMLCKNFVQLMHGKIKAELPSGGGTKFLVRLPVLKHDNK